MHCVGSGRSSVSSRHTRERFEAPKGRASVLVIALALLLGVVVVSCATPQASIDLAREDLLGSIPVGRATRADVLAELGIPSGRFEGDRILAYTVSYSSDQQKLAPAHEVAAEPPHFRAWVMQTTPVYDLILVFGSDGVLERSALIELR